MRASQADLVVCKEIHEHKPLDFGVLLHRYLEEMNHAIGRQADRDQNLLAATEFMWDAQVADRAEHLIEQHRAKISGITVYASRPRGRGGMR